MAIYDMNAAIDKPNLWGSFQQGRAQAQQLQQNQLALQASRQQVQDQNALRQLAPQILAGDPGALQQAAAISPEAAGQYQTAADGQLTKLRNMVDYIDRAKQTGNQAAVTAALGQAWPYIRQVVPAAPEVAPTAFTPEMEQGWEALKAKVAMAGSGQQQNVHSAFRGQNGNMWVLGRDGQVRDTGAAFDPNNQLIDTGAGWVGVNKTNLQAAPVMTGGMQPQQPAPQGPMQFTGADGVQVNIDPSLPPNVQAAIRAAEGQGGAIPDGATLQAGPQYVQAGGSMPGQLTSAPKPSEIMAQQNQALQMAKFNAQQSRTLSPEETQAAGFRPGTIVQEDGYGNRKVVQAPTQDRQAMSEAQRKDMLARRAKVPQLQNAIRGLDRIGDALGQLDGGMVNTGPMDAKVQKYTVKGQELESAVGAIQNSILSLTRVPGIGAQSDLEARMAALQYPSLDKAPEVNRRTLDQLKLFMRDLAKAYESAMQSDAGGASAPAEGGWSIKAID